MENPIILSFCVPTYNRANGVYECVTNILKYPGNDIEVVVSDNASTDNTQELLATINDSRFKYFRNETNIRFANFIKVISLGKGHFCALLSDEDDIIVESIEYYINLIKQNLSAGLLISTIKKKDSSLFYDFSNHFYPAGIKTLKILRFHFTHICGFIYNREKTNLNLNDYFYPQTILAVYNFYHYDVVSSDKALIVVDARRDKMDRLAITKKDDYYFEPNARINNMLPTMVNLYRQLPLSGFAMDTMIAYAIFDVIGMIKSIYLPTTDLSEFGLEKYNIKDFHYFDIKKKLYKKLDEITNWSSPLKRLFHLTVIHLLYWPIAFKSHIIEFLARVLSPQIKQKIKKLLHI